MNAGVDSDMEGEEVQIPSTIVDVGENSDAEPIHIHISTKLDNSIAAAVQAASEPEAGIYFRKCLVSLCEGNLISV